MRIINKTASKLGQQGDQPLSTADLAGARSQEEPRPDALPTSALGERDSNEHARTDAAEARRDVANVTPSSTEALPAAPRTAPLVAAAAPARTAEIPMAKTSESETGPLFSQDESRDLRSKWDGIQVGFVDEPRRAVQEADNLVAATMQRLAEQFAAERSTLESQWDRAGDVSTEDLRLALRRYRSFFGRLLAI